ncbi:short chain dehydrogenase [Spirillospora sp. NPDC047279]|uniref:short chain dehydrogenase n=1 Tax=Spirillospora sp. NPDC047279 TaxID=3155478 RepID=UPI0033D16426
MRILLIGATGTLGRAVHEALKGRGHEVVTASRTGSDLSVDITDPESIRALYAAAGRIDAVANTAGWVPWKPFGELTADDVRAGLAGKAFSQVELVRQGSALLAGGASFTLITGVLSRAAVAAGTMASLANGAVESFVRAVATELPHRQRVNVVSPTLFEESAVDYDAIFTGFRPVPVAEAARAYVRSVEGVQTGQVFVVE